MAQHEEIIPLAEEELVVSKKTSTTVVRIDVTNTVDAQSVSETLHYTDVVVERIAVGRFVATAPPVRVQDDVTIIPVLEEVLVVTKRLSLKEELHVRSIKRSEQVTEPISIRRQQASISRSLRSDSNG